MLLILTISFSFEFLTSAVTTPALSLKPSVVATQGLTIGSTFDVTVHVDNVENLWQWVFLLTWDPTVLTIQSGPTEGPFLRSAGTTFFNSAPKLNVTQGFLNETSCTLMALTGVSGSGDLATIKFKVVGYGTSQINFVDVSPVASLGGVPQTLDSPSPPIACTSVGTTFNLPNPNPTPTPSPTPSPSPSGAYGPTANFLPLDGTYYSKGETVFLDASSSLPGQDTVIANESCPIISYGWRVECLNGTVFKSFNGKTANFTAGNDDLRIILIVTASDPHPPSSPDFAEANSKSVLIHIASPQAGNIDVFLDRGGSGQNASSAPFFPQESIKIFGLVTYRNSSVPNTDVVFTIYDAKASAIAVRVARTNSTGFAHTEFRLPWPETSPESTFGIWSVGASVDILELTCNDWVSFNYNYAVAIETVQAPPVVYKQIDTLLNITLNGISATSILVAVTIYDAQMVPVCCFTIPYMQAQGNATITVKINVPSWAFVGQATMYVNVLSGSPDNGGVPYTYEHLSNFQVQN